MLFEEALKLMREGEKIRHAFWDKDVYLMACYVIFKGWDDLGNPVPPSKEDIDKLKKEGNIGVVKMNGDVQHDDMFSDAIKNKNPFFVPACGNKYLHSYPQLNLLYIMSDDWELYEQEVRR